jgi:hypothetical protein
MPGKNVKIQNVQGRNILSTVSLIPSVSTMICIRVFVFSYTHAHVRVIRPSCI